jgi:dimethylargininase
MTWFALTRRPALSLVNCELTHLARSPIDIALAKVQHQAYTSLLADLECRVRVLPALEEFPDSVFVEDAAVVLPEFALVTRPGAASRAAEAELLAAHLPADRPHIHLLPGARLDGGDVLVIGRRIFIGISTRTTAGAIDAVRAQAARHGYQVAAVPVPSALHLKTAVTALDAETILLNPAWFDSLPLAGLRPLTAPQAEPFGANVLSIGATRVVPSEHPLTAALLDAHGYSVRTTPISEFAKAEAGLTCLSVIWRQEDGG